MKFGIGILDYLPHIEYFNYIGLNRKMKKSSG